MRNSAGGEQRRSTDVQRAAMMAVLAGALGIAGCSSSTKPVEKAEINNKTKFSAVEYGVPASPRVTEEKKVAKGGGRYQVGKPYKIRGKWYTPKEDPTYVATGKASWYGPNFHGRLTANGEIYDQYALSAAHPTMPLPSYARVTNLKNNTSVIVRVNDRGPYAHGRVIDLSSKAADLLAFKNDGVAQVKVEYVGKARLEGSDEKFLLASYRGPGMPNIEPGATQPGTMIALAPARENPIAEATALLANSAPAAPVPGTFVVASGIPVPTPRPADYVGGTPFLVASGAGVAPLAFASPSVGERFEAAFAAVDRDAASNAPFPVVANGDAASSTALVSLGVFASDDSIDYVRHLFADLGVISARKVGGDEGRGGWELTMLVGGDVVDSAVAIAVARGMKDARKAPYEER